MAVSVAIITLNEETNIRRCLESVRWADEIIIVDCGSTDGTLETCEEYGCRVFNHEWEGYARQKNFAVSHATCDWVLSLDADEEVTPEMAGEIRSTLSGDSDAYSMPRSNLFLGKWMRHGGWWPDRQLRLFRRGMGSFKEVPLHEHIVMQEGSKIGLLRNPLRHYTYPTIHDFMAKADSYTTIQAQMSNRKPSAMGLLTAFPLKFAETYVYKGGWRDGIHGLLAALLGSVRILLKQVKMWEASVERKAE
jgi:glycosyltransferase involved in cell wall biosynthesis